MTNQNNNNQKTNTLADSKSDFGQRIREARQSSNLSQSELAAAIGVSDRAISSYEKGRNTPPISKLQRIADKTNYSLRFFVGEEEPLLAVRRLLANIDKLLAEIKELLSSRPD